MNIVLMLLVFFTVLSTSLVKADMMAFDQASSPVAPPNILKQNNLHPTLGVDPYRGISKSKISESLAQEVKKDHQFGARTKEAFKMITSSITEPSKKEDKIASLDLIAIDANRTHRRTINLVSSISPDYAVKRNLLTLYKGPTNRDNEAISFVFFMNPNKGQPVVKNSGDRTRMHVMWTGSKKIFTEQRMIAEDDAPVDVSMAQFNDGYTPEEWNFVMPNRKPRTVKVSLMWSF